MFEKIKQVFKIPDLRKKILIIIFLLIVFRIFIAIPIPGINEERLRELVAGNQMLGYLNIFSGGALGNLSIAMLGVAPYITATIILQLLTVVFPKLKEIFYEEGAIGREKFERLGRLLTVPLAALQSFGFLRFLSAQGIFAETALLNVLGNVIVITAGSMVILWLGELINKQQLGSGVSLIIFAGIVSGLPMSLGGGLENFRLGILRLDMILIFAILALAVIVGITIINAAERKIPVSYAKRIRGNRVYGGVSTYLPLKLNQAGVIPIIFAVSVLIFPQFIGQVLSGISPVAGERILEFFTKIQNNNLIYGILYFILVFIFTYFYTAIVFNPKEIAKNLQRSGGFLPGVRPGPPTISYLSSVISRITLFGAVFLGFVAILPIITQFLTDLPNLTIGGTALLIVVAVALEITKKIDSELKIREYEEFT
ncbi:MAG: preprotein translocase subunit SecY [Candidatus Liptonbacteria bacterium]|nr:preprotein translocase subunit SecY [Candidatus Liptonbacteria bacterium]